ncbi:ArsR family transcriptional regulator [Methanofollis formosanus]|uniref:ArsR family transcriptional regulator n=1 Tax=Methanofollis formosanus TaxID=299308 RepID=A0A8G1A3B2_9EURY|nr:winged helix-turn-helix domain-containing protein [Methanofollis formosanus]QYZ80285.1 ArsR family transcriptional regulator [Methanofollis formosanus]
MTSAPEECTCGQEIRDELRAIRRELRHLTEVRDHGYLDDLMAGLRKEYGRVAIGAHLESVQTGLEQHLDPGCAQREQCAEVFYRIIRESALKVGDGTVTPDEIVAQKEQLLALKEKAPSSTCNACFDATLLLLEKQAEIAEGFGLRDDRGNAEIDDIPVEETVRDLLEPAASVPRLNVLKALAESSLTFSDLSRLTGLRGGNLLFHLSRLEEAGLIVQRRNRGEYHLTGTGYLCLQGIAGICTALKPAKKNSFGQDRKI